jgi:putative membrane protein
MSAARTPIERVRLLARLGGPATQTDADAAGLGSGGEADVYALDADRVLRVFHGDPGPSAAELTAVYRRWAANARAGNRPSFGLPDVLDTGVDDGLHWQVLARLPGHPVNRWLTGLPANERQPLLDAYLDAVFEVAAVDAAAEYGTLLGGATYSSWAECLRARLTVPDPALRPELVARTDADGPVFDRVVGRFEQHLDELYDGPPRLVHVDYFPGNVMADMFTDVTLAEQQALVARARARVGARLDEVFDSYRVFYGLYYAMDPALLPWCAQLLRRAG